MEGQAKTMQTRRWWPGACTILSIVACYGALAAVGLLSLMGIAMTIEPGVQAVVISAFAMLAAAALFAGYRRHRVFWPFVLGMLGAALILWAMFGSYNRVVEAAGFMALIAAAIWDWRAAKVGRS